jgi:hypothetical protein
MVFREVEIDLYWRTEVGKNHLLIPFLHGNVILEGDHDVASVFEDAGESRTFVDIVAVALLEEIKKIVRKLTLDVGRIDAAPRAQG